MQRVEINRGDIRAVRMADAVSAPLGRGEARLRLRSAALTANNVTYAATGDVLGYWRFFPSGVEGWGLLPVWGHAEVTETACGIETGTRLYGFFPMAEECVLTPSAEDGGMIVDTAPHRAELPAVYNRYMRARPAPERDDHLRALLQPLLATSYLLADWLQANGFFEAEQIIIGSASSKTGLGLCKFLAEISPPGLSIVGLTSARNRGFVESLDACDSVVVYDAVETLPRVRSVYVDMAGNADVKARLHRHLADLLAHSSAVGTSHWDRFRPPANLPGPKPEFFFAPAQIARRREEWGPGVIERRIGEAYGRLASEAGEWLDIIAHDGIESVPEVYARVAGGDARPREGHIIRP